MRWIKRLLPALLWGVPLLLLLPSGELLLLASAILLHEAGHLLALSALGEPAPALSAVAAGLTLSLKRQLSYWREATVALAGPLANLLLGLPLLLFDGIGDSGRLVGAVHVLTAAMNLFPLRASDGGRALRAVASCLFPLRAAEAICNTVAVSTLTILLLFALFLLHSAGGGGALILLVGLLSRATAER